MSRSNDGLPMLPPWLADTEVTGVGQTNFRNYEPPPVENLPQDEVIPETPEPANGFFNRRGRGDDRSDSDGEKKKGKGWFRNKNKDEPSLEERVGELLPNNHGPRPSQRNNWAEGTSQWSTQQVPQAPADPHSGDPAQQPDALANPAPYQQAGPSAPAEQFPPVDRPAVPGPPNQPPPAPDGRVPWGPAEPGPQWSPGPDTRQGAAGTGLPPALPHQPQFTAPAQSTDAPPQPQFATPAPSTDAPWQPQFTAPAEPADAPVQPQYPGPALPNGRPDGSGEAASAAPATEQPSLPTRNPSAPAPEFERLRPHHPIPPHPARDGSAPPAVHGGAAATGPDSTGAAGQTGGSGAPDTGERGFLPPPPPLPDAPPSATAPDAGPIEQQPIRRLPDLPPAPPNREPDPVAGRDEPAPVSDTAEPGRERELAPDESSSARYTSGAHSAVGGVDPIADGPAPAPESQTGASGPEHGPGDRYDATTAHGPDSAPDQARGPAPTSGQWRAPESAPANPVAGAAEQAIGSAATGVEQWRAPESAPANQAAGSTEQAMGPAAAGAAQWRAPESAPSDGAPGQRWRAPEQPTAWQSGPQHAAPTSTPPNLPPQHGGPAAGHPGPVGPSNQPPAQQWQQPVPPAVPGPPQHGGSGPAGWQQPNPHAGPMQNPQQQFGAPGPHGPSLEDVSVRRAKKPAGSGWRKVVHHASGGKINPGMSAEERRMLELVARIRQPVRGDYRIAVLSLKGGVGKTTTTIGLGSTFASIRGDRVIAVDANPDFGTLSQRVPLQTRSTVRDLLLDPAIQRYSDVRRHTSQATSRLEVLASERDPAASEAFNEDEYRAVARILQRFYNIILTDCGTGLMHSAMAGVLQLAHSLVLISPTAIDGAQSASATLDWLSLHGYHHLVQNAVVVINSPRDGTPNIDVQQLRQYFLSRCRAVHMIPFDPHMSEGAEIDLPRLKKETKRAYVELAATVADDFGRSYHLQHGG
ncbi:AAA family ATPase [Nocardia sp. CA-290969]|uniref:MinD/ParA family ATP-binding protein n=1 Tax=Nocardia sp. CA-290969 TaxID=3239986 RepID=UPI003D8B79B9